MWVDCLVNKHLVYLEPTYLVHEYKMKDIEELFLLGKDIIPNIRLHSTPHSLKYIKLCKCRDGKGFYPTRYVINHERDFRLNI